MFEAIFGYLTVDHLMAAAAGVLGVQGTIALKDLVSGAVTHGKSLLAAAKALEAQAAKTASTDVSKVQAVVAAVAPVAPVASAPASAPFGGAAPAVEPVVAK